MKAFIAFISLLAIIWWIVAKLVNKYSWAARHDGTHLPDSPAFFICGLIAFVVGMFLAVIPAQECGVVVTPGALKRRAILPVGTS